MRRSETERRRASNYWSIKTYKYVESDALESDSARLYH